MTSQANSMKTTAKIGIYLTLIVTDSEYTLHENHAIVANVALLSNIPTSFLEAISIAKSKDIDL